MQSSPVNSISPGIFIRGEVRVRRVIAVCGAAASSTRRGYAPDRRGISISLWLLR